MSHADHSVSSHAEIPERFRVARKTLVFDRFMHHFIKLGGIGIIVAVFLIFVFILLQIWPLFAGADVTYRKSVALTPSDIKAFGIDEYGELPFFVASDGTFHFFDATENNVNQRGWFTQAYERPDGVRFSAIRYNERSGQVVLGTEDGRFSVVSLNYRVTYPEHGREVISELEALPFNFLGQEGAPIELLDYGDSATRKLAAGIQRVGDRVELHAVTLRQSRSLFGVSEIEVDRAFDLTHLLEGEEPSMLRVSWEADSILVATRDGTVRYLFLERGEFQLRQVFRPFDDLKESSIERMDFVLGDVSIVLSGEAGTARVWSLFRDPATNRRLFGETKAFPAFDGGATYFASSLRNKAFLTGSGKVASLRYMTTETVRWEDELPFEPVLAQIGPRYDRLVFVGDDNHVHFYDLSDPHPVAGWKSYFGKIHYEGQAEPSYEWQSTGGRDDFERKLSMIPLIIGTLKGTFYALIFAVPIALLGAIYTSQFLQPDLRRYVKPVMEIMASLPSVVLGFIAALWLAPIVSNNVPSVGLAVLGMILAAIACGVGWTQLPVRYRVLVRPGYEFLFVMPIIVASGWAGWKLGPLVSQQLFTVTDSQTGITITDFRMWYPQAFGLSFEQRNAFVVGFVMGFAVIPIIFTIAEDSLSNVPGAFRSASLALGASRWQTAMRVVLPTASAGIFSGLMIGLGRAVGETMIVVMATGNVPVTNFNPFTGMRTLSANIAVELPEAPYLGTLYRTLFLGAMLLFLMTFAVNTGAEVLRQKLRERYRAVE